MAEQLLKPGADLRLFRLKRFQLFGQFSIAELRVFESTLSGCQFFQRGLFFLTQTIDERNRFLDALLQMTESVKVDGGSGNFLMGGCHKIRLRQELDQPERPRGLL